MGINRYAAKIDASQPDIVAALRKFGVHVEIIGRPVDLLCFYNGLWMLGEAKPVGWRGYGKKQAKQREFVEKFKIPIWTTPAEAIESVTGYQVGKYR